MQHRHRLSLMLAAALGGTAYAATGEYYGPGYTLLSAAEGGNDLQTVVYRQLYPGTVGQALPQLLEGTGWRLAENYAADVRIYRLYNQPLPEYKLRIGPMPLDKALTSIAGEGWELVVDPVNRLVSFEVRERYDTTPSPMAAARKTAVTPSVPVHADTYPPASVPIHADTYLPASAGYPVTSLLPAAPYPPSLHAYDTVPAQGGFSTLHYLNEPAPMPSRVTSKRRADATSVRPATQRADNPADAVPASGRRVIAAAKAGRQPRRTAAVTGETAAVETGNTRKSSHFPSTAARTAPAAPTSPAATGKVTPDKAGNAQHSASAVNAGTKDTATGNHAMSDVGKTATAAAVPANNKDKTGTASPATAIQTSSSSTRHETVPSATAAQVGKSKTATNPAQGPATTAPAATSPKEAPAAATSSAPASKAGTAASPATEKSATAEPALLHQQQAKPAPAGATSNAGDAAAQPATPQSSSAPAPTAAPAATDSHTTVTAPTAPPPSIAKPPLKAAGQPVPTDDVVVGKPPVPRPPLAVPKAVAPGETTPAATGERAP